MIDPTLPAIYRLDEGSVALIVKVPIELVVIFQAYFELHEALAIVRTVDRARSIVSLITTNDCVDDVRALLHALHDSIPWEIPEQTPDQEWSVLK